MSIPITINPLGRSNSKNFIQVPLTFTAKQVNSSIKLTVNGSLTLNNLQYKTNKDENWKSYIINDQIILENINDYVQFRNNSNRLSTSNSNYAQFVMSGLIYGSGNIQSLLNFSDIVPDYSFRRLFQNCSVLKTPPILYALSAGTYSYASMFNSCGINKPPIIKAKSVGKYCCYYMFQNCNQLLVASQLPATIINDYCYSHMFYHCSNIVYSMKVLPAISIATRCYQYMFCGCSKLKYTITILPALILKEACYANMFDSCTILQYAPELPAVSLVLTCYNNMFAYCYNLKHIKVGFTEWISNCTKYWFSNGTTSGIFECPYELDISIRDNTHILSNWSIINF